MFNRRLSLLFLSAALSGTPVADAAEADGEVPLSFTRLELTDGRKLRNVVVKSYDAKSEKPTPFVALVRIGHNLPLLATRTGRIGFVRCMFRPDPLVLAPLAFAAAR